MERFLVVTAVVALVSSFVALLLLKAVAVKIGGYLGKMIRFMLLGILFAVVIHSAFELSSAFDVISENTLMIIMGILLTLGSVCFICASYFGFKTIK